jgi:hypothetical protein
VTNWLYKTCFATCLLGWACFPATTAAQQPASLEPAALRTIEEAAPASKAKPKKVWTEETIAEVRTPTDIYLDSKAAAQALLEARSKAIEEADAKGMGTLPVVLTMPCSDTEAQAAIEERKSAAENLHKLVANAQERLQSETDATVRETLTEKAKLLDLEISSTNAEIKALEKALNDRKDGKTAAPAKNEGRANNSDASRSAAESGANSNL